MSKSINLLPKKGRVSGPNPNILSILQKVSFIGLIIVVFISITLFALSYDTTLPKLKQQENADLAKLTLMHEKSVKILLVKDRLSSIGSILKSRNSYETLISQISKLLPDTISIDTIDIANGTVSLTVSSRSLSDLSDVLDTLTDMVNSKQIFKSVNIDSITAAGQTAKYTVIIKAGLI